MTAAHRALAAFAGFACVGALAAGFLDPLAAWARVVVALTGVLVAPALLLGPPLARVLCSGRVAPLVIVPAALVAAFSAHAIVAGIFSRLGASFSLYATCVIWLLLLSSGAVLVQALRGRRPVVAAASLRRPL
ncbi:MAG TPA: hypothetical protein VFT13_04575, partial [Candidatus Krumholzibacteria bacterium]|nr:hypothetical protein [Candidatus Krumholzibacteria bacterium]